MSKQKQAPVDNTTIIKLLEDNFQVRFQRNLALIADEIVFNCNLPEKEQRIEPIHNGNFGKIIGWCRTLSYMWGEDLAKESTIKHALAEECYANSYNPIFKYLTRCHDQYVPVNKEWVKSEKTEFTAPIEDLLESIELVDPNLNHIKDVFVRKWLLGCVGRVYEGFQNYTLIIPGKQGIGKSTFFRKLCDRVGMNYFKNDMIDPRSKDDVLALASTFIWCSDEFNGLIQCAKNDRTRVKEFLTKDVIRQRPFFGRAVELFKRNCSIAGTVNESEFLNDPTGNRRYLILPEVAKFDFEKLNSVDVDYLWGQCVNDWMRHGNLAALLSDEEIQWQNKINEESFENDPLEDEIRTWVQKDVGGFIPTAHLVIKARSNPLASYTMKDGALQKRLRDILLRMGFVSGRPDPKGPRGFVGIAWKNNCAPSLTRNEQNLTIWSGLKSVPKKGKED